jgi:stage II sporulation protein AA (anti-sigma F factor antagonist)
LTVTDSISTAVIHVRRAPHTDLYAPNELLVLSVDGELDGLTSDAFGLALTTETGAAGGPDVLLDLGRLYHLDSTGLLALTEAATVLARAGRRLTLAAVRPRVREFLAFSGAEALVPVFPTLELAVEHARLSRPLA